MHSIAFQTTGFAFQGFGQLAFQGLRVPPSPPDNEKKRRRSAYKPTGLIDRKIEAPDLSTESEVISDEVETAHELAPQIPKDALLKASAETSVERMSLLDINRKVARILDKPIKTDEDAAILFILIAAEI